MEKPDSFFLLLYVQALETPEWETCFDVGQTTWQPRSAHLRGQQGLKEARSQRVGLRV